MIDDNYIYNNSKSKWNDIIIAWILVCFVYTDTKF